MRANSFQLDPRRLSRGLLMLTLKLNGWNVGYRVVQRVFKGCIHLLNERGYEDHEFSVVGADAHIYMKHKKKDNL
jgi:hypothetical protein